MGLRLVNDSIFLHIPKTGGTFASDFLSSQRLVKESAGGKHDDVFRCLYPQDWRSRGERVVKELVPKLINQFSFEKGSHDWKTGPRPEQPTEDSLPFMFCFVRNPISWIESYYHFCVREEWYQWSSEYDYSGFWHPNAILNSLKSKTFNEFIEKLLKKRPGYVTELFGWYTTAGVDFIGKTEELRSDLKKVLDLQNLSYDNERLKIMKNKNVSQKAPGKSMWDEALLQEFIACEYSAFVRYGYEIPII